MRTYERGVEDETYSCGTGVVAASLCFSKLTQTPEHKIQVITKGGNLAVEFDKSDIGFENIFLIGPAQKIFEGQFIVI